AVRAMCIVFSLHVPSPPHIYTLSLHDALPILAADYAGVNNGRVRDVPDRRTVRFYTTLGLIDRPAALRGRTALYGRRHLLQLARSEEHTSELQSLAYLVCRLLLEKKK